MKLLASVALATVLAASAASAQIVTKLSGIQPLEHPSSYAEKFFAEQVAILTKGTVKVETYANTQLGDAVANVQSVRNGTIGFTVVSASNLNQVVPAMDMLSLPFIFKNEAHFWWYLAQPVAEESVKALADKGVKKIRVMASPVMVKTMEALGATGVPVAWAELYTALQTGVVDAAENNHPSVVAKKFYEVSKYYTIDEHMRIPDLLVVSMKFYNSLNDQQKAAVMQAGALTQAYMRGAWKISENKDLAELKAKFTQILDVDKQPFMDAVAPLVSAESKRLNVEKTVAFILESGKKF